MIVIFVAFNLVELRFTFDGSGKYIIGFVVIQDEDIFVSLTRGESEPSSQIGIGFVDG